MSLRNAQLLQQMAAHPLRSSLAKALDIAETFAGDVEFLTLDKDLSPQGRENARQSKLRAAVRDLRDARAPINELQTKLDKKRAAISMPKFDQSDLLGFLKRQELRSALRAAANTGQRTLLLEDPIFADACLEQPAALSGLHPQHGDGDAKDQGNQDFILVEAVKKRRLETLFAQELDEITAMEETIGQANDIANIARGDLMLHSGFKDQRVFEEFVRPIEAKRNAHWLKKTLDLDGNERTIVLDLAPGAPTSRWATEREILDGKYYRDHAEYLADRAT